MDKYLTVNEVAEMLKLERRTICRWIKTGRLPAFKPGPSRFWRVRRSDFQRLVKSNKEG